MGKYIIKSILSLFLVFFSLCLPKIIEKIITLLYYTQKTLFCEPGDALIWITLCCSFLCCCIGGVISYDYIKHEYTRKYIKFLVIAYCFVLSVPLLFINNRIIITDENAICYNSIGNIQKEHQLLEADDISITFHNRTYKSLFSNYTITYSFSYNNIYEFTVEIEMYNRKQLDDLITLHEKILGDKTTVGIELGSFQHNSDAERIKELFK